MIARGKAQELRDELRQSGDKRDKGFIKKKTALKKIVANMTMGNDSRSLTPVLWMILTL
jgi:vesicle coat complex subunit